MKLFLTLFASASLFFAGCDYDNYDEPKSTLSGSVIHDGKPIGVRTNGVQLELWQDGFQVRSLIPVYINQDGSYSASLFDGVYKLVRKGNSPWLQQSTDTLLIEVKGNTKKDVPVTPYFTISNESFSFSNNSITANFKVDKVVSTANIDAIRLYLGNSMLTDEARYEHRVTAYMGTIVLGANATIATQLPASLKNLSHVFARIGVKSTSSGEYYYTQVQKIALK
ncbi:DUF3823 domain-containing protein [Desertivirga arenae]|uniref:DUF3823 domain-containing protein n=1 Tax=Desertivirga arenae TaxID=2810309 RepID=UPI001A971CC5|nr:DUF3823 domain-containing protein [Pedobacter sp. SYSU D00823]